MSSEEIHIIGILDESLTSGSITPQEIKSLMCDYLQITPYHPVLLEVLNEDGLELKEKTKIDIQSIFKAVSSAFFIRNIPSFYNNRVTKYTIKLLKAAIIIYTRGLLTMNEIREAASAHQMGEFKNLAVGVPCDAKTVHSILWAIRRTISNLVLEKWISANKNYLDQPGTLMAHEFLYLVCNCVDKMEMLLKIPKIPMNVKREKKAQLFHIDKDFPKTYETPDHKIQHMMGSVINIEKAYVEGLCSSSTNNQKPAQKSNRKQPSKHDQNQEDGPDSFRKKLRGMVLTVGIKTKLKEYHQKLIRSRLNGKAAYDKLVSMGETGLPSPLDLASQMKQEGISPTKSKKPLLLSRPQTAQHGHTLSLTSQKIGMSPSRPASSKFPSYPQTPLKISSSVNKIPPSTENVIKIQSKYPSEFSSPNLKSTNRRTNSQFSSLTNLGQRDVELFNMYESIIGEEYEVFEAQNRPENKDKRAKSTAYFNSSHIGPKQTRIYSSKPNSPQLPPTPLADRLFF